MGHANHFNYTHFSNPARDSPNPPSSVTTTPRTPPPPQYQPPTAPATRSCSNHPYFSAHSDQTFITRFNTTSQPTPNLSIRTREPATPPPPPKLKPTPATPAPVTFSPLPPPALPLPFTTRTRTLPLRLQLSPLQQQIRRRELETIRSEIRALRLDRKLSDCGAGSGEKAEVMHIENRDCSCDFEVGMQEPRSTGCGFRRLVGWLGFWRHKRRLDDR